MEDGEKIIQSKEDESIEKFLELIPLDLIPDILLRLTAKSAVRFRVVSKLWSTISTRPGFIRLFAIQSSKRPCLLACVKTRNKRLFVSLPQHEHPDTCYSRYEIKSPSCDYESHRYSESVNGLMCWGDFCSEIVVWNPTMRQHVTLPDPGCPFKSYYLGYDPVEDKYKVLCIRGRAYLDSLVFTLGPQESWRVIQNCPKHFVPLWPDGGICINGHVYYEAEMRSEVDNTFEMEILMSFDVRYEKFNIIRKPADPTLIGCIMLNYQGKLACLCDVDTCIRFWVLEDEEKQEWSPRNFLLPFPIYPLCDPIWEDVNCSLLEGICHDTGEFIFTDARFKAIYVIYYDPKRNSIRRVIYEGIGYKKLLESCNEIHLYPNHCESLISLENVTSALCVDSETYSP